MVPLIQSLPFQRCCTGLCRTACLQQTVPQLRWEATMIQEMGCCPSRRWKSWSGWSRRDL